MTAETNPYPITFQHKAHIYHPLTIANQPQAILTMAHWPPGPAQLPRCSAQGTTAVPNVTLEASSPGSQGKNPVACYGDE